jgi:hypothetical protein
MLNSRGFVDMNIHNDRVFYIDFDSIRMCYPYEVSKRVAGGFGKLEEYRDKKYTMMEMNRIIAELIQNPPYIPESMDLTICVLRGRAYHHILSFKNYDYKNQTREESPTIKFLYG